MNRASLAIVLALVACSPQRQPTPAFAPAPVAPSTPTTPVDRPKAGVPRKLHTLDKLQRRIDELTARTDKHLRRIESREAPSDDGEQHSAPPLRQ